MNNLIDILIPPDWLGGVTMRPLTFVENLAICVIIGLAIIGFFLICQGIAYLIWGRE
jgi:hypothetical protein